MGEIEKFIIMEDDIARDGGRYPEYTYIIFPQSKQDREGKKYLPVSWCVKFA